jgi:hypothetical protein
MVAELLGVMAGVLFQVAHHTFFGHTTPHTIIRESILYMIAGSSR